MKNDIDWENIPKNWVDRLPQKLKTLYYHHIQWRWFRLLSHINTHCNQFWLMWDTGIYKYLMLYIDFIFLYLHLKYQFKTGVVRGRLEAFSETGTEGFVWSIYQSGKSGYEGLIPLSKGDRLVIILHNGHIVFDNIIDPDHKAGYQNYPLNPQYGQPSAFGCWIHWTQKGWTPEEWASLFFHSVVSSKEHHRLHPETDKVPYRAILIKKSPK